MSEGSEAGRGVQRDLCGARSECEAGRSECRSVSAGVCARDAHTKSVGEEAMAAGPAF